MNQNTNVLNIYDALINVIYLVYQLQYQVFQCLRLFSLFSVIPPFIMNHLDKKSFMKVSYYKQQEWVSFWKIGYG